MSGERLDAASVAVRAVNPHFTSFVSSDGVLVSHFVNNWSRKTLKNNKNNHGEKILIKYEAIFENSKLKY